MKLNVHVANPLPAALSHYALELAETLERIGYQSVPFYTLPVEGRTGGSSRFAMFRNAVTNARRSSGIQEALFLTWPSLGLWDARLWRSKEALRLVAIHDPIPIRRQVGYDSLSRKLVGMSRSHLPVIVSHSDDALSDAEALLPRHRHVKLLHPLQSFQSSMTPAQSSKSVVVAGQYKPERNMSLLRELGPMLSTIGVTGKIFGSGWPDVPGWEVYSRFLSEIELDAVLSSADVVLIPYKRYYQSGIALRALEVGTMSLSPVNSFAKDVFGQDGLVLDADEPEEWLRNIQKILESPDISETTFNRYRSRVDENWKDVLGTLLQDGRLS